jgi:hypothetical protein
LQHFTKLNTTWALIHRWWFVSQTEQNLFSIYSTGGCLFPKPNNACALCIPQVVVCFPNQTKLVPNLFHRWLFDSQTKQNLCSIYSTGGCLIPTLNKTCALSIPQVVVKFQN